MSTDTRCEWSDLPPETCACPEHRGDDRAITPGDVRVSEPAPAVKIWPEAKRIPTATPPTTRTTEPVDDLRVQAARDLRAIRDMAAMLGERATDLATDQLMPGGEATVNLAHVADRGAWEANLSRTETEALEAASDGVLARAYTSVADEDPDESWSVLQRLDYWTADWRTHLGMDYGQRPTITSEAAFASHPDVIEWASSNEQGWGEAVEDFRRARVQLENLVRDGVQEVRSRVVCDRCAEPKRLIRKWGKGSESDVWKAPCCKAIYTEDEANRALARRLRSQGVERWIDRAEAVSAIMVQGWTEAEVLEMLGGDEPVEFACDPKTRRIRLWWPSLWTKHLQAKHDRQMRAWEREEQKARRDANRKACAEAHGEDCWDRGCTANRRRKSA